MENVQSEGPFCQSCGMPMKRPEDFGTNDDGTKNDDYCNYCFQKGKFTDPGITLTQMIDKVFGMLVQMKIMPEALARETTKTFIPKLKRWQDE